MNTGFATDKILEVGTIGLPKAGKTVYHSVLYGCRNDFDGVTFSFTDEPTIRYLRPIWEKLDAGEPLPEATGVARPTVLAFEVHGTAGDGVTQRTFSVRTSDYAGVLVSRGRAEDIEKLAREIGLESFVDGCDLLFVMMDISDDTQVHSQLDMLEYVLRRSHEAPTRHGSPIRPVAVVFTKADMVLTNLDASLLDAQNELLNWLLRHNRWKGLSRCLADRLKDKRYSMTFPVSCFGQSCSPGQPPPKGSILPRWAHEPLVWALPVAAELAEAAVQENAKAARRAQQEQDAAQERVRRQAEIDRRNKMLTRFTRYGIVGGLLSGFLAGGLGGLIGWAGMTSIVHFALGLLWGGAAGAFVFAILGAIISSNQNGRYVTHEICCGCDTKKTWQWGEPKEETVQGFVLVGAIIGGIIGAIIDVETLQYWTNIQSWGANEGLLWGGIGGVTVGLIAGLIVAANTDDN